MKISIYRSLFHYVDKAIENLEKNPNKGDREPSVLEKLLKVDRHVAVVMALDMLLAGVDTVSSASNIISLRPERIKILRFRLLRHRQIACTIWQRTRKSKKNCGPKYRQYRLMKMIN